MKIKICSPVKRINYSILFVFLYALGMNAYALSAPSGIYVDQRGQNVALSWGSVSDAQGYNLYYAPYPGGNPVMSVVMGLATSFAVQIGTCEAYYVAVTAYKDGQVIDPETGLPLMEEGPVTVEKQAVWETRESGYSSIGIVKSVNPSFFPIRSCSGALAANSWNFLLNEGHILVDTSVKFSPGDMKFNQGEIWIDTDAIQFVQESSGVYVKGGIDSGGFSKGTSYDLVLSSADAFGRKTSEIYVNQFIDDAGIGLIGEIEVDSVIEDKPENPISWPLSRTDLHELPIGSVIGVSHHADTKSTINVSIVKPIVDKRYMDAEIDFNSSWVIVEKIPAITVLGVTYYNIVVVDNLIHGQYINLMGKVEKQNRVVSYWLSRGVGMVKGRDVFEAEADKKPFLVELDSYKVMD